jgi:hypothetical protein
MLGSKVLNDNTLNAKEGAEVRNALKDEGREVLDSKVDEFTGDHGIRFSIPTTYSVDSVTLRRDTSKMILFQTTSYPVCAQIDYKNIARKDILKGDNIEINSEQSIKSRFQYLSRPESASALTVENQRFYNKLYGIQKPYMSKSQDFMFFPYLSSPFHNGIDVYDCSKEEFFLSDQEVSRNDAFFVCTLAIDPIQAAMFGKVVTHRDNNNLVFIVGKDYILKFDLSTAVNGALDIDNSKKKVKPEDTYRLTQTTYDRIIDININKRDVGESWVTLQSSEFNLIHFIKYRELLQASQDAEEGYEMGVNFFQSEEDLKIKVIDETAPQSFWSKIKI